MRRRKFFFKNENIIWNKFIYDIKIILMILLVKGNNILLK
jgi:hypothetical protein